jgi:hypothetical protein
MADGQLTGPAAGLEERMIAKDGGEEMKEIKVKHECGSCHGTGLYSGMGEGKGAAVVCHSCKGTGWCESVFQPFTGRKELPGIKRVYQVNPGIRIGKGNGFRLEDFGGMPLANWIAGEPFKPGMESRAFTCPRWWEQCTPGPIPGWKECDACLGSSFSQCPHFENKAACWERWDKERAV